MEGILHPLLRHFNQENWAPYVPVVPRGSQGAGVRVEVGLVESVGPESAGAVASQGAPVSVVTWLALADS